MKRQILLLTAGLMMLTGATNTNAYNGAQYHSVKNGKQSCQWCDLKGADFRKAKLSGIDLFGANLTDANLAGAVFTNVDLSRVYFTGADLSGAAFIGTTFAGAHLEGVDLTIIDAPDANFETAYCDWQTKLPEGWACSGTVLEHK